MVWPEAILAFFLAFFFIILLSLVFGMDWWDPQPRAKVAGSRPRPWGGAWLGFFILFLLIWAVGVWVDPVGPVFHGVAWLPFLIVAVFAALLLAGVSGGKTRWHRARGSWGARTDTGSQEPLKTEDSPELEDTRAGMTLLFWVLFVGLVVVIVLAYL